MNSAYHFGAMGDGSTDDTAALQHAIEEGNGVLQLQKGTFRITKPLVLDCRKTGFVSVRGTGGTSQIVMEGEGPAIRIIGDHRGTATPSTIKEHTWEKERFPTVTDVAIVGKHPNADGIELVRTMQTTISKALIRNCRDGIRLVERNRNFILSDSHLYHNLRYGLHFDHCNLHQIIVHGNHISYNQRAGIRSSNGDVHNLQITGNDIEYNNRPGKDTESEGGAEISFEAPEGIISEVTIASNTIQATIQPGGANIRIRGSAKNRPRGGRLIAITGNVIGSQTKGIELTNCQRVAISGNTIYSSRQLSLHAQFCSGMTVGCNTLIWRGEVEDPPQDGVLLEDCENALVSGIATQRLCYGSKEFGAGFTLVRCNDSSISDCQILDPRFRGVELRDCNRCRISNNTVLDRKPAPTMSHAIRVQGGSNNLIQNNLVGSATIKSILCGQNTAIEQGNHEIKS